MLPGGGQAPAPMVHPPAASTSFESLLEKQSLGSHLDLPIQTRISTRTPGDSYVHYDFRGSGVDSGAVVLHPGYTLGLWGWQKLFKNVCYSGILISSFIEQLLCASTIVRSPYALTKPHKHQEGGPYCLYYALEAQRNPVTCSRSHSKPVYGRVGTRSLTPEPMFLTIMLFLNKVPLLWSEQVLGNMLYDQTLIYLMM